MPTICFLVLLSVIPSGSGQGFLDASRLAQATNASGSVDLKADANTATTDDASRMPENVQIDDDSSADVDSADAATDSEIKSDIEVEATDLRETRKEMKHTDEWLKGGEVSTDEAEDGGSNEQDEYNDGNKDTDELQNEVEFLQDELPPPSDKAQNIEESDESPPDGLDDGKNDPALLQTYESDAEVDEELQDESSSGEDNTESVDPDEPTWEGDIHNETALLQKMVHQLLGETVAAEQQQLPDDPELITVLIQTMKKHMKRHAAMLGAHDHLDDHMADESNEDENSDDSGQSDHESDHESSDEGEADAESQTMSAAEHLEAEHEVSALEDEGNEDAAAAETEAGADNEETAIESEEAMQDESESLDAPGV